MHTPVSLSLAFALLLSLSPAPADSPPQPQPLDRTTLLQRLNGDSTWRKLDPVHPSLSSRALFSTALAWCEAGLHFDRMEQLFDFATRMQDRDPSSRSYGNFRWSWSHQTIFDYNAVDFSLRGGALVWSRHRDKLTPAAREKLRELLAFGIEGCLRHRVRESYTNIALMNAGDLILAGEALDNAAAAQEGYTRLERVLLYTAEAGIHEYSSPTYYAVDLEDLLLIEAFCREDRGREQARALLELFWQDIALNFFPAGSKYAGANSRSYDYLRGRGILDLHLQLAGWIGGKPASGSDSIYTLLGRWQPPAELQALSRARLPRTVRQVWGFEPGQARTHYLTPEVTLSTASASYGGRMDFPLTVDLAGPLDAVRAYFTSDARGDPYGKNKIPESTTRPESHAKALHLSPFWMAAQHGTDALGLVVYREGDVPPDAPLLQSHFVMPRDVDTVYAGHRTVPFAPGKAQSIPLAPGEAVVLRKGSAAAAVRVPWSNGAPAALVHDAHEPAAIRLTVDHRGPGAGTLPAAAFHVRIGTGLKTEADFSAWRAAFSQAPAEVKANPEQIHLQAAGLTLEAAAPFAEPGRIDPAPTRAVLELDGQDIGRQILSQTEAVRKQAAADARLVAVAASTSWEAEAGRMVPPMMASPDSAASGGQFVNAPNGSGSSQGSVRWRLQLAEAGSYHLWARVLAPTPEDDSFFVSAATGDQAVLPLTEWPVGVHPAWDWVLFRHRQTRKALPLPLPAGESILELRCREDGTQVDRLFLTRDPAARPPQ